MAESWFCLRGEVDLATAPQLRVDLAAVIGRNRADLIVDCTGLTFIDPIGTAILLETQQDLEASGLHLVLVNVASVPRRTFEMLGVAELLQYDGEPAT